MQGVGEASAPEDVERTAGAVAGEWLNGTLTHLFDEFDPARRERRRR